MPGITQDARSVPTVAERTDSAKDYKIFNENELQLIGLFQTIKSLKEKTHHHHDLQNRRDLKATHNQLQRYVFQLKLQNKITIYHKNTCIRRLINALKHVSGLFLEAIALALTVASTVFFSVPLPVIIPTIVVSVIAGLFISLSVPAIVRKYHRDLSIKTLKLRIQKQAVDLQINIINQLDNNRLVITQKNAAIKQFYVRKFSQTSAFRKSLNTFFLTFGFLTILPKPILCLLGYAALGTTAASGVGLIITMTLSSIAALCVAARTGYNYYHQARQRDLELQKIQHKENLVQAATTRLCINDSVEQIKKRQQTITFLNHTHFSTQDAQRPDAITQVQQRLKCA